MILIDQVIARTRSSTWERNDRNDIIGADNPDDLPEDRSFLRYELRHPESNGSSVVLQPKTTLKAVDCSGAIRRDAANSQVYRRRINDDEMEIHGRVQGFACAQKILHRRKADSNRQGAKIDYDISEPTEINFAQALDNLLSSDWG